PALGAMAYRTLHQELLAESQACLSRAGQADAALLKRMIDLAQPWLTLEALDGTDHETLLNLSKQCRLIAVKLGGGGRSHMWLWAIAFALFALGSWFLFNHFDGALPLPSWASAVQRQPIVYLGVLIPLAVGAAAYVARKFVRST